MIKELKNIVSIDAEMYVKQEQHRTQKQYPRTTPKVELLRFGKNLFQIYL